MNDKIATTHQDDARFRVLFESVDNVAVQGYDRHRRVIYWNPASEALYGYSRAEALGRPIKLVEDTNPQALQAAPRSIAELEANDRSTRERNITDKVKMHPALRNVLKHLGGSLEHISYL